LALFLLAGIGSNAKAGTIFIADRQPGQKVLWGVFRSSKRSKEWLPG